MIDCEVCLKPVWDPIEVTFSTGEITCAVQFCRDCITDVFQKMAQRYNAAVDANNEMVAEMLRWLGISEGLPSCPTMTGAEKESSHE